MKFEALPQNLPTELRKTTKKGQCPYIVELNLLCQPRVQPSALWSSGTKGCKTLPSKEYQESLNQKYKTDTGWPGIVVTL